MLVLSRRAEEEIRIGSDIRIRVLRVSGSTVRLGIEAPRQTTIVRGELGEEDSALLWSGNALGDVSAEASG